MKLAKGIDLAHESVNSHSKILLRIDQVTIGKQGTSILPRMVTTTSPEPIVARQLPSYSV
jgi:hypothetical protein